MNTPRPRPPYMTSGHVAALFGVTTETVGQWGARGWLTRTRPRPRAPWRYAEGEVLALYQRLTQAAADVLHSGS